MKVLISDNIVVIKKRFFKVLIVSAIKIFLKDADNEAKYFKLKHYEAIFIYIGNLRISVNLLSITEKSVLQFQQ